MASVSSHGTGKHGCFCALSWGHRDLCSIYFCTVFDIVSQLTFFFFLRLSPTCSSHSSYLVSTRSLGVSQDTQIHQL